jgi:hypothetical protein
VRWFAAIVLVAYAAHAEAQEAPRPFGVVASAGIGTTTIGERDGYEPVTAMQLDVGVRRRELMIGGHIGFQSGTLRYVDHYMSMYSEGWIYLYRPMQLGVSGHHAIGDRFYASLSTGVQVGWTRLECSWFGREERATTCRSGDSSFAGMSGIAFGAGLGADAFEVNGHRLTITITLSHGLLMSVPGEHTNVWLGVGYRFWDR